MTRRARDEAQSGSPAHGGSGAPTGISPRRRACYNDNMGPEDAVPKHCPHCGRADRIVRATDVRPDAGETAVDDVDVALPAHETWSALLIGAVALLFVSAMATHGAAVPGNNESLASGLMLAAFALGVVGLLRTRRIKARMRAVEPHVRGYHEHALYCENCAHIHFRTHLLPQGVAPFVAWTLHDYRRQLWYACGFVNRAR
jgi:hypothetical protein